MLRSKVELEQLAWRCLSLRGRGGRRRRRPGLLAVLAERGVLALPFEWNGWTGVDLLGPRGRGARARRRRRSPTASCRAAPEAVEACRIVSGIPAMGTELTDKTIAAEAGLVERTVSFTKGCYTGQELVARIDSRGSNVARRLVGVVAPAGRPEGDPLAPGHDAARRGGARRRRRRRRQGGRDDHLGGLEQRARGVGGARATCTAASRRPARSGCARATASAARARPGSRCSRSSATADPSAGLTGSPRRCLHRSTAAAGAPGAAALVVPAAAYALGAAATTAFTRPANLVTALPIVALAVLVVARWPLRPRPLEAAAGGTAGHPYRAWVALLGGDRRVGAGPVRRPGQPGRPPDPELHGRRGRPPLRPQGARLLRLARAWAR